MLNSAPHVVGRRSCDCAVQVFLRRHGSPSIENLTRLVYHQYAGLKKAFWMFDFPVCTTLQKLGFSAAGIKGQPVSLVTDARYFLVRIANTFEIQIPMSLCLIR